MRSSQRRRNPGRSVGSNEHPAWETLEPRTVGVAGGYAHADVTASPEVLAGWITACPNARRFGAAPRQFQFRPAMLGPGTKAIMGHRHPATGYPQGVAVPGDPARQPATAHFIAHDPPVGAVRRMVRAQPDDVSTALLYAAISFNLSSETRRAKLTPVRRRSWPDAQDRAAQGEDGIMRYMAKRPAGAETAKIHRRTLALALSLAIALPLLAACGNPTVSESVKQSFDVNKEVGRSENKVMLLNIVRAAYRRPLIFTNYTQYQDAAPTTNFTFSFAPPATDGSEIQHDSSTQQVQAQPLDLNNLFIHGITSPITGAEYSYYASQGWYKSLLFHLFVSEIRVYTVSWSSSAAAAGGGSDGKSSARHKAKNEMKISLFHTYSNYPYDLGTYRIFDGLANELGACRSRKTRVESAGGDTSSEVTNMTANASKEPGGFRIRSTTKTTNDSAAGDSASAQEDSRFQYPGPNTGRAAAMDNACRSALDTIGHLSCRDAAKKTQTNTAANGGTGNASGSGKPNKRKTRCYRLTLRSPRDIVQYLGEIVREEQIGDRNGHPAEVLGVVTFSDACFYERDDVGTDESESCAPSCHVLFDPVVSARYAASKREISATPHCHFPYWSEKFPVRGSGALKSEVREWFGSGHLIKVDFGKQKFVLPGVSRYPDESMHTLQMLEMLIGWQAGLEAGSAPSGTAGS